MYGAAVAFSLTYLFMFFNLFFYNKKFNYIFFTLSKALIALCSVLFIFLLSNIYKPESILLSLFYKIGLLSLLPIIIWKMKYFTKAEVDFIKQKIFKKNK